MLPLPLPEALFLLALHDERGTVHPSAYIAIDKGLRAAILGELRARRRLRVGEDSVSLRSEEPTGGALLDRALELVVGLPSPSPVRVWLEALESGIPDIREAVVAGLVERGVLARQVKDLPDLVSQEHLPTADGTHEVQLRERLREVLLEGGDVRPRTWHLVSLVAACNLIEIHFHGAERDVAEHQAWTVLEADALGTAVAHWRARTEGTWEF